MTRLELIAKVKIKLDEYVPNSIDHPLNQYIDPTLNEAAKKLLLDMPIERLHSDTFNVDPGNGAITSDVVNVWLPEMVLRLKSVKFTKWKRSITHFYGEGSKEDSFQGNPVTRGTADRPVIIVSKVKIPVATGFTTRLTIYGGNITAYKDITIKVINKQFPENLSSDLTDPLVCLTSAMVAQILERDKASQILMAQYLQYLQ